MNHQFIARWNGGRGNGFIGYCPSRKTDIGHCGPLLYTLPFTVVPVSVSNTSLSDGMTEAWATMPDGSKVGPMFIPVVEIFDSASTAAAFTKQCIRDHIAAKNLQIDQLHADIKVMQQVIEGVY